MSSSEKGNNGIVITAAHLDESEIPHNFLLMYKDIAKDTAYYLDTKHVLPTVSIQKVFIEGVDDAVIVDSKEGHFFVEVANTEQITAGLSGKRVYARDNKTVIGFVSQLTVDNQLLCRVLE